MPHPWHETSVGRVANMDPSKFLPKPREREIHINQDPIRHLVHFYLRFPRCRFSDGFPCFLCFRCLKGASPSNMQDGRYIGFFCEVIIPGSTENEMRNILRLNFMVVNL